MKAQNPIRIPYHRADIGNEELMEIAEVLDSGWLTSGKKAREFEQQFSIRKGFAPAIAVNSCTSGLFLALRTLDPEPGDEVITSPYTFAATANIILHTGARPVFVDIEPDTLNIDPQRVETAITENTLACIPIHLGGNPCDMTSLVHLAQKHQFELVEDCAHAIEGSWNQQPLGTFGYAASFSFYANKNLTTGEGGMLLCRDESVEARARLLMNHGLNKTSDERSKAGNLPLYDVLEPGYKFNLPDILAAIGVVQMEKMDAMYQRRIALKAMYDSIFEECDLVRIPKISPKGKSALHLYPLLLNLEKLKCTRNEFLAAALEEGIQLSVNYTPIHLFSWYKKQFGFEPMDFPHALAAGNAEISLPFYPKLSDENAAFVCERLLFLLKKHAQTS